MYLFYLFRTRYIREKIGTLIQKLGCKSFSSLWSLHREFFSLRHELSRNDNINGKMIENKFEKNIIRRIKNFRSRNWSWRKISNRLNEIRKVFQQEKHLDNPIDYIKNQINDILFKVCQKSLKPVINGTGIILHTGLGRAPISKEILIEGIIQNYPYSNLEININNGKRGDRNTHISTLISRVCYAEESIVVNNN